MSAPDSTPTQGQTPPGEPTKPERSAQAYAPHALALPFVQTVEPRFHQGELRWLLHGPDEHASFHVHLHTSHLGWPQVEHLLARSSSEPTLVLAPVIGAPMGRRLREAGVCYLDLRGNAFVRLGDRYLAHYEGRTSPHKPKIARSLRAPAYQALFALLAQPELAQEPLRTIAHASGVSTQAVVNLLGHLVEQGLMARASSGHRWTEHHRRSALSRWLVAWPDLVRPRLWLGSYKPQNQDPEALERELDVHLAGLPWRLGGAAAAAKLTGHFRSLRTVVHLASPPPADLAKRLRAWPHPTGELTLLGIPGPLALQGATPNTVHPLLVYGELLAEGDERARETAQEIRERFLPWA